MVLLRSPLGVFTWFAWLRGSYFCIVAWLVFLHGCMASIFVMVAWLVWLACGWFFIFYFIFLATWFKFLLIFNFMIFIDFNLYFIFILFYLYFISCMRKSTIWKEDHRNYWQRKVYSCRWSVNIHVPGKLIQRESPLERKRQVESLFWEDSQIIYGKESENVNLNNGIHLEGGWIGVL